MGMTWKDLAELRAAGQKPLLPIIVTTWPKPWRPHAREIFERGAMVITHKSGEPIPVKLLDGLRVILALDSCDQTSAVCRLLAARGVKAQSIHGWCQCYREFTACPAKCAETHEQIAALEACNAA
jgi:hypothetical protein